MLIQSISYRGSFFRLGLCNAGHSRWHLTGRRSAKNEAARQHTMSLVQVQLLRFSASPTPEEDAGPSIVEGLEAGSLLCMPDDWYVYRTTS